LQERSNIDPQRAAAVKRNSVLGTILVELLLFSVLFLVGFSVPYPPPETGEGILVNFGTDETGLGLIEPSPPAGQVKTSPPPAVEEASQPETVKTTARTASKTTLTQDNADAPVVKTDPEAAKKKLEKKEADRILNEQKEAEKKRISEEEAEKNRIAAEQQRESDIKNRTKNALAGSMNTGTSSTSEGIAGGPGNQGDPNGSVDSKVRGTGSGTGTSGTGTGNNGISYKLEGRGARSLPEPKYDYNNEGKVVVEVSVDRSGKVVQAVPGVKGSTTLEEYFLKVAKEAALGATFEVKQDAPPIQKGVITYNFKLK
jgi:colicin import membrane protein